MDIWKQIFLPALSTDNCDSMERRHFTPWWYNHPHFADWLHLEASGLLYNGTYSWVNIVKQRCQSHCSFNGKCWPRCHAGKDIFPFNSIWFLGRQFQQLLWLLPPSPGAIRSLHWWLVWAPECSRIHFSFPPVSVSFSFACLVLKSLFIVLLY